MKRQFFIYSLPRSGSSWLSQFLSMPGSFCYHEPLADHTLPDILDKMETRPEPCVGLIDTSAHQKDLAKLENCNYYVIHRDLQEIDKSLKLKGWVINIQEEQKKLHLASAAAGCINLHYKWFNDLGYLRNVWDSIVDSPFDQERAEYLMEMNVQREFASVKKRVERCRA